MAHKLNLMLFVSTIATLCVIVLSEDTTIKPYFNCNVNATGIKFDRARIAGNWYEVARFPQTDVPACVNVNASAALDVNNLYNLQIKYVNNANSKWEPQSQVLQFPWTNETEHGIFAVSEGTFRIYATNYDRLTIVCGTTDKSTASVVKFMAREPLPSAEVVNAILYLAGQYDVSLTWVQQDQKCAVIDEDEDDGAEKITPTLVLLFAVFYVLRSIIF